MENNVKIITLLTDRLEIIKELYRLEVYGKYSYITH